MDSIYGVNFEDIKAIKFSGEVFRNVDKVKQDGDFMEIDDVHGHTFRTHVANLEAVSEEHI